VAEKKFNSFKDAQTFARQLVGQGMRNFFIKPSPDGGFILNGDISDEDIEKPKLQEDGNALMVDCLKDCRRPETKEDCDQFIGEIRLLLEDKDFPIIDEKIFAEALRTIRELSLIQPKLPTFFVHNDKLEYKKKERELEKFAPTCRKCGVPLILQKGGASGYFWGCRNYSLPQKDKCYVTVRLSNENWTVLG